jgi:hypothetical protein
MQSLTSVYFISLVVVSLVGVGSAFLGNMIHPIKGGADYVPPTPADVAKATAEAERASNEADKKAKELRDAEKFQIEKSRNSPLPPSPPAPAPAPAPPPLPPSLSSERITEGVQGLEEVSQNIRRS